MSRFVAIPAARLLDELRDIGGRVVGSAVTETCVGREIVFGLTLPNKVQIRVYTSISRGAESARECGEDAIRLVIGAEHKGKFKPLGKSRKILRTAPQGTEEDRIVAFLARLRQAMREVYKTARAIPNCPWCGGTMAERKSVHGPFWGCTQYPECRGTRPPACEEGGTCQFTPDYEYDITGKTITCEKCGEPPPAECKGTRPRPLTGGPT